MAQGKVKWFDTKKGYGFIEPDDGTKDAFLHISALQASNISSIDEGDIIGVIQEEDILKNCLNNKKGFSDQISNVMSKKINLLDSKASIDELSKILKNDNFAMIMENNTFIGLLTKVDLLAYLKKDI